MALTFAHYVPTKTFTPQEYLVEILSSAKNKNVIISLEGITNKVFVILKLIQELAFKMHRKSEKRKWTLLVLEEAEIDQYMFYIGCLTDLKPLVIKSVKHLDFINYDVIVTTENLCLEIFEKKCLHFDQLNLAILNNCQKITVENSTYFKICNFIKPNTKCRILGIVHPLFELDSDPFFIEDQLKFISHKLFSSIETVSDIISILHHCCKPKEVLIECAVQTEYLTNIRIKSMVLSLTEFLNDHNYEHDIIHRDDEKVHKELKKIHNTENEPLQMVAELLDILKTMGPYCAEKVALKLLYMVEKLKVKTMNERHFELLCSVSTLLVQIRATFDNIFFNYSNIDKVLKFSTPRVLRTVNTLNQFKPKSLKADNNIVEVCKDQKGNKDKTIKSKSIKHNCKSAKEYITQRKQRDPCEETVCAIILVNNKMTASVLYHLFIDLKKSNKEDFGWIQPQYTVYNKADPITEPKEFKIEQKNRDDILNSFRKREFNVLIGTKELEAGIDLPRCNLVINYNIPLSYKSYLRSKSIANALDAHYVLIFDEHATSNILSCFKLYNDINQMLLTHCSLKYIDMEKEIYADRYNWFVSPFKPGKKEDSAFVDMSTAIGLVNRYCAKLHSDTFTKLYPIWKIQSVVYENQPMFVCSIRLPVNSSIKHEIHGHPMPCEILSKRIAALEVCRQLHSQGELDDTLQPVTKELFYALINPEEVLSDTDDALIPWDTKETIPGTAGTYKRHQYYYKRTAETLNDCRPVEGKPCHLYAILLNMNCPIPEEQNIKGRKIHPPEESIHGFGILTTKHIPSIPLFPIYTRCGEIHVSLKPIKTDMFLTLHQLDNIATFLNYTFINVLDFKKCNVAFDPTTTHNCYYIVPTLRDASGSIDIDWKIIDNVHKYKDNKLSIITDEDRINFQPDIEVLRDAVVTPWYRRHEQFQYFYVEEICTHLNPKSPFPQCIEDYKTFEDFYYHRYSLKIQNLEQPLLDVDLTSVRLNFLTPRYTTRKGVNLLPTSDSTKRAYQKTILVPELCNVQLFPASMWRKAVSLPSILYRINALLLADEIRTIVAKDISLGLVNLSFDHIWKPLDFNWPAKDVLIKRKEQKEISIIKVVEPVETGQQFVDEEKTEKKIDKSDDLNSMDINSNDMADLAKNNIDNATKVRYSSPTSWMIQRDNEPSTFSDVESDDGIQVYGLRVEFKNTYLAEAVDKNDSKTNKLFFFKNNEAPDSWTWNDNFHSVTEYKSNQQDEKIVNLIYKKDDEIIINREVKSSSNIDSSSLLKLPWELNPDTGYGLSDINILSNNASFMPEYNKCIKSETHINNKTIASINKVNDKQTETFSFDFQPDLNDHPGPSPSILLQALTMSSANDGINMERLETIGDSFLKYAITAYLYCTHNDIQEGILNFLRSKQVSNLNLYRLGKLKMFAERMMSTKFCPRKNWLPPCYFGPHELEKIPIKSNIPFAYHSINDKSIADCVEALIGAYLISCGTRGALIFMSWLGLRVLPTLDDSKLGYLKPQSPILLHVNDPEGELTKLMDGFESFEEHLGYCFQDRSYLLQAMTHASYYPNCLTDCYQRLEILGDAVLNYLITRHLYEDKRQHSPGALTDLRAALVNNIIFASLAVRIGFHKYLKHLSPSLSEVICRFVTTREENGHTIDEEFYYLGEDDFDDVEDVEAPKILGDIFKSVAGAIYLDSNMSFDAVWKVYHKIMENEMKLFSKNVPISPIRELLQLEPTKIKFSKPESLADGRRVRVVVEIIGKGEFKGIGRNRGIAKCSAAKSALNYLKKKTKK